jgi:hypothetical protein
MLMRHAAVTDVPPCSELREEEEMGEVIAVMGEVGTTAINRYLSNPYFS